MAMSTELTAAAVLSGANLALLVVLTYVWLQNYRRFKTPLVLGLLAFSAVLALENAAAIYFFFSTGMFYASDPTVQGVVALLRGLQFVALCFLAYVTLK
ncbi:hypothetical protein [Natronobiforma cellulositropha]|uniref:hypothetical protein n=1 Tax=Natronobiforma cellulositropha TaxID=1679076 RepID=UPI0021D60AB4|nr:hypothetical protein [Natronobiforma cellulositropha]